MLKHGKVRVIKNGTVKVLDSKVSNKKYTYEDTKLDGYIERYNYRYILRQVIA